MHFFPTGGPNTPFLLRSSFAMMISWVWLAEVRAEKLMQLGVYFSLGSFTKKLLLMIDLPVPVGPTNSMGISCDR